ncbi:MAG: hypothetical protein OSB39_09565 [Opitutales bacterium]|nr:hypothetical protein [Opitutales bacterium]
MARIVAIWRDSLHTILDIYERRRGPLRIFFPLLFLFFVFLNVGCYWWGIFTAFPQYMLTYEANHYLKLQFPVGILGALFDSLSFFVTIWIIRRALTAKSTTEYVMHLSLDLVIAVVATFWVLFVFTAGGWFISLFESVPEELTLRGEKYTTRAVQALQDPTGRENAKNIYFGIIMGVSAALPTCLHLLLFFRSCLQAFRKKVFGTNLGDNQTKEEHSLSEK